MNAECSYPVRPEDVYAVLHEAYVEFAILTRGDERYPGGKVGQMFQSGEPAVLAARMLSESGYRTGPGLEQLYLYGHEGTPITDPDGVGTVKIPKTEREYVHMGCHSFALLESIARHPDSMAGLFKLLHGDDIEQRVKAHSMLYQIAHWGRKSRR